jgi:hypothetical protein
MPTAGSGSPPRFTRSMPCRYISTFKAKPHSSRKPQAMSDALERTCKALKINGHAMDRETIATRIIDLVRSGVIDATALSDRVIAETNALREH